ncbi:hypothetical protein D3C75_1199880 [compost metagenome]
MLLRVFLHRYVLALVCVDVFRLWITDFKPGGVCQQMFYGYFRIEWILEVQTLHIGLKISLQVDLTLLNKLHDRSCCEGFGD